jgi:Flp pilus assembly protein TadD
MRNAITKLIHAFLVFVLLGTASPAGAGSRADAARDELRKTIRERGLDPDELVYPDELTDEMRAWVRKVVPSAAPETLQVQRLLAALENPNQLGLAYEVGYTGTAAEVFETRKFNCLSFTHTFVALAREVGARVYYLQVPNIERYSKEGDLIFVNRHMTAGFDLGAERMILEFNTGPQTNYRAAFPVSDLQALAMFYSNRGAEYLSTGRGEEAVEWIELAISMDPQMTDAWVNLGVARRRTGDMSGAEAAYKQAVSLDPKALPAYHNLATLMRVRGDQAAAKKMIQMLDRPGNRDPFMFLALGDMSLREGRFEDAKRYFRRAYRLQRKHPETRAGMGLLAFQTGDLEAANEWLDKARKVEPQNPRVLQLARNLGQNPD